MSGVKAWRFLAHVGIRAALLFVACNIVFALVNPLDALGHVSLYNALLPGRLRLPFNRGDANAYSVNITNLPALFASHVAAQPKAPDEYRVFLFGDSATWGTFLRNDQTYTGNLNAAALNSADGRRIVTYNLGYPRASLTQNLLLLDYAMQYQPDYMIWLVTLEALEPDRQLLTPLVADNPARMRDLIARYNLRLNPYDEAFSETSFLDQTIVGQRQMLNDWFRNQVYAFAWANTGIDQEATEYDLRATDLDDDVSWDVFDAPVTLTPADLAFDVLAAGVKRAGDVPITIINEPIYISDGDNSDIRYNAYYPRWAYDQYRELLAQQAAEQGWHYLDWWDRIAPNNFTNTPLHLTPNGSNRMGIRLGRVIVQRSSQQPAEEARVVRQ